MSAQQQGSQRSDVVRLLIQISNEYEAAKRGQKGPAQGTAQHRFITKRMENIGDLHMQLRGLVGDAAMPLIIEQLEKPASSSTLS